MLLGGWSEVKHFEILGSLRSFWCLGGAWHLADNWSHEPSVEKFCHGFDLRLPFELGVLVEVLVGSVDLGVGLDILVVGGGLFELESVILLLILDLILLIQSQIIIEHIVKILKILILQS